jgi:hypothetical protein
MPIYTAGRTVKMNWEDLLLKLTGVDPRVCPVCGKGKMVIREIINSNRRDFVKTLISLNRLNKFLTFYGKLLIESP